MNNFEDQILHFFDTFSQFLEQHFNQKKYFPIEIDPTKQITKAKQHSEENFVDGFVLDFRGDNREEIKFHGSFQICTKSGKSVKFDLCLKPQFESKLNPSSSFGGVHPPKTFFSKTFERQIVKQRFFASVANFSIHIM